MLETLIIFLLLWLWVIERRLNNLGESVQAIKLDADGMQTVKYLVDSEIAKFRSELARIRHRYASWSRNEPDLVKSSALMIISSCRHGLRAPIAA